MNTEQITMFVVTMVIIPFFVPFAKDLFANIYITCMNLMKGKPTWKVGTKFQTFTLPSGVMFDLCTIVKVDFGTITITAAAKEWCYETKAWVDIYQQFTVKKSHMLKGNFFVTSKVY